MANREMIPAHKLLVGQKVELIDDEDNFKYARDRKLTLWTITDIRERYGLLNSDSTEMQRILYVDCERELTEDDLGVPMDVLSDTIRRNIGSTAKTITVQRTAVFLATHYANVEAP